MSGAFDQISHHNTFSCERLIRKAFFIISLGRDFFEVTVNTREKKERKKKEKAELNQILLAKIVYFFTSFLPFVERSFIDLNFYHGSPHMIIIKFRGKS